MSKPFFRLRLESSEFIHQQSVGKRGDINVQHTRDRRESRYSNHSHQKPFGRKVAFERSKLREIPINTFMLVYNIYFMSYSRVK